MDVVTSPAYAKLMELLHESHPGVTRMKSLARSYVWWPGMDATIENLAKACASCQEFQKSPPKAPLHPWEWPECAWSRIHIDYAGPLPLMVDAFSKWIEVHVVKSATSLATIDKMRSTFATHRIPEMLVTDNGSVSPVRSCKILSSPMGSNMSPHHHTTYQPMDWPREQSRRSNRQ